MSESIFESIIEEYADREWEKYSNVPEHKFSLKHRLAMKRILRRYEKNTRKLRPNSDIEIRNVRRRAAVVVLAIIFAVLSGCTAAYFISQSFRGEVHSNNTELFPIKLENCPTVIEEKYYLSELPDGFEIVSTRSNPFSMTLIYENKQTGQKIEFDQWVKSEFGSTHYNTENGKLLEVEINGYYGVLIELSKDQNNWIMVLWDNGNYILELSGNLAKEDVLNLAKSTKLLENPNS